MWKIVVEIGEREWVDYLIVDATLSEARKLALQAAHRDHPHRIGFRCVDQVNFGRRR